MPCAWPGCASTADQQPADDNPLCLSHALHLADACNRWATRCRVAVTDRQLNRQAREARLRPAAH